LERLLAHGAAKYRALDAWRGICAVIVVLYHLSVAGTFYDLPLVRNGGQGVDFFFVLSGFVIAHAYGHRITDLASGAAFVIRRFGRLYPLHIFTLGLMVLLELIKLMMVQHGGISAGAAPFTNGTSVDALLGNLLLINGLGFFKVFTWNGPSWSISTEFFAYLAFLCITLTLPRHFRLAAILIALTAAATLIANGATLHPLTTVQGEGLMRCLYGFFLGTLVYRVFMALSPRLAPAGWWEVAALVTAVLAFVVPLPFNGTIPPLIFAGVVFLFAFEHGPISKCLATPIPRHLGLISYSIYLMHFPAIEFMNGAARALQSKLHVKLFVPHGGALLLKFGPAIAMDGFALVFVLIVIGASTLSYRWIEDPARRYFNKLSSGIGRPRAMTAAE
jgi:peptidoglycan/LPS O-acetylase OafA/YrhL